MKLVGRIITDVLLVIACLVAMVFAFVELRSLFAGDFLLMNSPALSFMGYLFRGLFFLTLVVYIIYLFISFIKNKGYSIACHIIAPSLFIASIFSLFFYVQYIYLAVIIIALIPSIAVFTRRFLVK